MQIYEITKRPVNEAGFMQGLATGLTSALGKIGVGAVDPSVYQSKGGPEMNRQQAFQLAQQLGRTLTPLMIKNWKSQVQAELVKSKDKDGNPVTSIADLTPDSQNKLKAALDLIVNQAIEPRGSYKYSDLAKYAPDDQMSQNQAKQTSLNMIKAVDEIYKSTMAGQDSTKAWNTLVTAGIAPAQNIIAFDNNRGIGAGGVKVTPGQAAIRPTGLPYPDDYEINFGQGWVTRDPKNPQHMAFLRKQAGLA